MVAEETGRVAAVEEVTKSVAPVVLAAVAEVRLLPAVHVLVQVQDPLFLLDFLALPVEPEEAVLVTVAAALVASVVEAEVLRTFLQVAALAEVRAVLPEEVVGREADKDDEV